MNSRTKTTIRDINPAKPVIPTVRSLPPSITIKAIPAVAFRVPCMIAAAITDFALTVK